MPRAIPRNLFTGRLRTGVGITMQRVPVALGAAVEWANPAAGFCMFRLNSDQRMNPPDRTLQSKEGSVDTILVVEDSRPMQRTLQRLFEADGLRVQIASDGIAGLESFRKQPPNVVVLDLKLPRLPGKELCRAFKAQAPWVPIVVLSANADVEDKVLLLELGADDYVTKPFSPKELLARVRRAMRRSGAKAEVTTNLTNDRAAHEELAFGDVQVDFTSMEAKRQNITLTLTAQEFKLLKFFAHSPGRVFSREELLNEV